MLQRTRFEKFKGKKQIEDYVEELRRAAEQADLTPEEKQRFFALLDRAVAEVKRGKTKTMRMVTGAVDSALKKFNSERDSKTSASSPTMAAEI